MRIIFSKEKLLSEYLSGNVDSSSYFNFIHCCRRCSDSIIPNSSQNNILGCIGNILQYIWSLPG